MLQDRLRQLLPDGGLWIICIAGMALSVSCFIDCAVKANEMQGWVLAAGALAVILVLAWMVLICRRGVLFVDQVVPACLIVVGFLGVVLPLIPGKVMFAVMATKLIAGIVLLIAWLLRVAPMEENDKATPPRSMLVKPLAYLAVYAAVTCLSFGLILETYFPDFRSFNAGVGFAAGVIGAGLCVYLVRVFLDASKGIDVLTRFSLIGLILAWLIFLQPSFSGIALFLSGIGFGVFLYILMRLMTDLYIAFRLKTAYILGICMDAIAALLIGGGLGWLLWHAGIVEEVPGIIVIVCIAAVCIVTVYGLSSDRVWTADGFTDQDNGLGVKGGRWRAACEDTATEHSLTPREAEVLFLLSKGRNAAYIEEKLVVSPHTVKSHMLNIYRKLGVHSQQELISCVEGHVKE